ncbi:hypothetical protein Patl1_04190 [Pistacia atlantica]|uniref:Uncharacterized protein n=1 Tax=Pistacia atlantica TaxID=434234 RepID=A0ACC1BSP0_9ROSI|nr:hypothetical protein Patl1_04190 [Pistacia atlantica]
MKALKNVSLSYVDLSLKSLKFLIDLKTLELIHCNLRDISSLKHLAKIEILSLRFSLFDEFPKELGALTELRLLDLRDCRRLKRIPSNVIPRFSQLEELYVGDYFGEKEDEETSTEGSNASLSELNSLSNLVVLFLEINGKCLLKDLGSICNKLRRYDISVNTGTEFSYVSESRKRALTVKDVEEASLITFESLYHAPEYLCLKEVIGCDSILPSIDKGGLNKLISLVLEDCKDVKCIIDTAQLCVPAPSFSNLVQLSLTRLDLLREICCGPHGKLQSVSLENLETVDVAECPGMCSLFPAMLLQRLYKLKEVTIQSCDKLEEIFQLDGLCHSGEENLVMLSSLAELDLAELPQLRCIWKGPTHIVNLKSLAKVEVRECKSLIYLFTLSVAQSLVQLRSLNVSDCESLKHLIVTEEGDNDKEEEILPESHHAAIVLPNLENLSIGGLPQLRCIWSGPSYHVKLPSLTDVGVRECKTLIYLFTLSALLGKVWSKLNHSNLKSLVYAPRLKQVFYLDNGSEENVVVGDGKETQNLRILGIGSSNQLYDTLLSGLKDGFFKNLEILSICNYGVKVLFPLEDGEQHLFSLPNLETLELGYLQELEGLCNKSPTLVLSLENLTTLYLYHCDRLRNIFSPSLAQNLSQLQFLKIYECGELEEIIVEEDEENQILFFQNLFAISVVSCPKIRRLFAITVAPRLQKLKEIFVYDNSELEEVFGDKDVADVMDHKEIVLPQLHWLYLNQLPSLSKFCPMSPFEGAPEEFDQTIFAVRKDRTIGPAEGLAHNFVKEQQRKRSYTDTANFTLRCGVCQIGVIGQKEAVEHAQATGHANFQEYR